MLPNETLRFVDSGRRTAGLRDRVDCGAEMILGVRLAAEELNLVVVFGTLLPSRPKHCLHTYDAGLMMLSMNDVMRMLAASCLEVDDLTISGESWVVFETIARPAGPWQSLLVLNSHSTSFIPSSYL